MRAVLPNPAVVAPAVLTLCLMALLLPGPLEAAPQKEYAFLLLQGTIADPSQGRPAEGAIVRLSRGDEVREATTDDRGVFRFERLPVASYQMSVLNSKGETVRAMRQIDVDVPNLKRFEMRFGPGQPATFALVEPGEDGVQVTAPEPPVRWRRFWKQMAIFAGCAVVLAL